MIIIRVKDELDILCPPYVLHFTPPAGLRDIDGGGEAEDSDHGDDDLKELGGEGSGSS